MFLCDLIEGAAMTLDRLGLSQIPLLGNLIMGALEGLWDLLGC